MKAIEILLETKKVNEAPAGLIGQGLKKVGAGILGAMGAKHMAGSLAGSADVGAKANELEGNFQRYLAQTGKTSKTADYSDLAAFLKQNKIRYPLATASGPLDQKSIDSIFTKIAQNSFKGASASSASGTSGSTQPGQQAQNEPQQTSFSNSPSSSGQGSAPVGSGKVTMAQLKASIAKLPKNQIAALRQLIATTAGTA